MVNLYLNYSDYEATTNSIIFANISPDFEKMRCTYGSQKSLSRLCNRTIERSFK
jgi:hypothetical protein